MYCDNQIRLLIMASSITTQPLTQNGEHTINIFIQNTNTQNYKSNKEFTCVNV